MKNNYFLSKKVLLLVFVSVAKDAPIQIIRPRTKSSKNGILDHEDSTKP